VEFKNTGTKPIHLWFGEYDVKDESGNIVHYRNVVSEYPIS
jgi:hypothetical protein